MIYESEIFSMGEPQENTRGLPGIPGLCNLGRRYSLEILGELGIRKFFNFLLIAPTVYIFMTAFLIMVV